MPISGGELLGSLNASQHQNMLAGMMGGANSNGAVSEALAGGVLSRGLAVGGPMGMMGLGLMGLDPMSLGLRAGMNAWRGGAGVMGAMGSGLAFAAPAAVGLAGMGYAASQVVSGSQQQSGLNNSLRQFNFMNGQGGMGFTSQQGFQIGNQIRQMTHEFGPQGEAQTFGELSRLASNMGRMGLAQNVRSVQEFKEKFKEMVSTLKTVAHDMGTSLEEAQKFIVAMKGSGIFTKADQLRVSAGTRSLALAGGLAQSEITGGANIGSQISRSIGGLGRQGAYAGMQTVGMVGLAQRTGALSEEDIYNATGLTGAEGRQAFAASQLQRSANFLRSGRGRKFVASIAGENGELNEEAVSEWMSGGLTTKRTMELARSNLKGVGRADFLRNEGRLRGAALERFGGMLQTKVYKDWLTSKGYDPSNMDDKAMLAFQRFTGQGRDEADASIKQIQALPDMLREYRQEQNMQGYNDAMTKRLNTTGIEGLSRKVTQIKEGINSRLQSVGSSILQVGQEQIESWFNEVMGIYESQTNQSAERALSAMHQGGSRSAQAFKVLQLTGRGGPLGVADMGKQASEEMNEYYRRQRKYSVLQASAAAATPDDAITAYAKRNSEFIRSRSISASSFSPDVMIGTVERQLREAAKTGDKDAQALLVRMQGSAQDKASIVQAIQNEAGVSGGTNLMASLKAAVKADMPLRQGGFATVADEEQYMGGLLTGQAKLDKKGNLVERSRSYELGYLFGGESGGKAFNKLFGDGDERRSYARFFSGRDSKTAGMLTGLYSSDRDDQTMARSGLMGFIENLRGSKKFSDLSTDDQGSLKGAAQAMITADPRFKKNLDRLNRGEDVSNYELAPMLQEYAKLTGDMPRNAAGLEKLRAELMGVSKYGASVLDRSKMNDRRKLADRLNEEGSAERQRLTSIGIAQYDKNNQLVLSKSGEDRLKGFGADAQAAARLALSSVSTLVDEQNLDSVYQRRSAVGGAFADLDLKTKKGMASVGGLIGDLAGQAASTEESWRGMMRKGQGNLGALSKSLGLGALNAKQLKELKGLSTNEAVDRLLSRAGVEDKSMAGELVALLGDKDKDGKTISTGRRADGIENITAGVREKLEEGKKQREANADPTYKLLSQHVPEQTKYLKLLVQGSDKSASLLEKLDNPEGTKNYSGG